MSDFFQPSQNDGKHIFVFGSNLSGRHGRGAAFTAKQFWGARNGKGIGRWGQSYAIPTKDEELFVLPIRDIRKYVEEFLAYARAEKELTFLVTAVGCGLAGYKDEAIAPMFKDAPPNCVLPSAWKTILQDLKTSTQRPQRS
jgi:hypothetical protein